VDVGNGRAEPPLHRSYFRRARICSLHGHFPAHADVIVAADFDEERGRPFTWLVTLARSRAIDRLRVLASRQRLADSAAQEVAGEASDAVADTLHAEQREIVARALATLPEEQRRTLKLAYFEGLTQSEIATQLGTPLGTVKTRMRTGMMKLRELLGEQMRGLLGSELG